MKLFCNRKLQPGIVTVGGSRTLEIFNNTEQAGKEFWDVYVFFQKRGRKSLVSISDHDPEKSENTHLIFGLFIGKDVEPLTGSRFVGTTTTDGERVTMVISNPGGVLSQGGEEWILTRNLGWQKHQEVA